MDGIELLAPAGDFDTALAAFAYGADAVYLGLDAFSARAQAVNFSAGQLADLMGVARAKGRKVYVTFNTLLSDAELPDAAEKLALLEDIAPDALIVQDLGVARLVRKWFPSLALHASTQMAAHNLEGVLALRELGFTRVVLARELPIEDIRSIAGRCGCEIEVFVHGALCYSISGLCLFSAMEKGRSGNRGRCAYCCRLAYTDGEGRRARPFSMKDLRLDDRLEALREAGVASLKIEGRMKSALYVSSVVKRYRELLDGGPPETSRADLETVFSRVTTRLYADGWRPPAEPVIDPVNLGHQGAPVGRVKHLTKDRNGRTWMRIHTLRAVERHDGLQFSSGGEMLRGEDERPLGMGVGDMRLAASRALAFAAPAGSDVEIEVADPHLIAALNAVNARSVDVACTLSNAVKRRFPIPPFRPGDYPGTARIDLAVKIAPDGVTAEGSFKPEVQSSSFTREPLAESVTLPLPAVQKADHPERTEQALRRCLGRLGGTVWTLGTLTLDDPDGLFVPASVMNELRRTLVARLDAARVRRRAEKIATVRASLAGGTLPADDLPPRNRRVKIRLGQTVPAGDWDEIVVAIGHDGELDGFDTSVRLALPVFTKEEDFNRFRGRVKNLLRAGFRKWEAADLAGLRMLRALGVDDLTSDWTLYAMNAQAVAALSELGVTRCVLSPESAGAGADLGAAPCRRLEWLAQQSTPLFISVTKPEMPDCSRFRDDDGNTFATFERDGLWITVRTAPCRFPAPNDASTRIDLSWDAP